MSQRWGHGTAGHLTKTFLFTLTPPLFILPSLSPSLFLPILSPYLLLFHTLFWAGAWTNTAKVIDVFRYMIHAALS